MKTPELGQVSPSGASWLEEVACYPSGTRPAGHYAIERGFPYTNFHCFQGNVASQYMQFFSIDLLTILRKTKHLLKLVRLLLLGQEQRLLG